MGAMDSVEELREYLASHGISVSTDTANRLNVEGLQDLASVVRRCLRLS